MLEILQFAAQDGWHMFVTLSVICLPLGIGGLLLSEVLKALTGHWEPKQPRHQDDA